MSTEAKNFPLRELYLQAIRLEDDAERESFLDDACKNQPQLRSRLEGLLAARQDERAGALLEKAAANMQIDEDFLGGDGFRGSSDQSPQGTRELQGRSDSHSTSRSEGRGSSINIADHPMIGHFKLLEEIGHGGMGTVYMAQQTEPVKRQVSLKVIKPGMDTREVIARFEAERQALAMMDHPNIAKVFDGGTTDQGRPYFVMELVRGVTITEFCKHKKLSLRDRLELFVDVCKAVQHAHQKGIIHRDLKPSNLLVTMHDQVPVIKVIDFGVAKALNQELTDKTLFTQFSQMIGTPLYMAPEQAQMSGLDIDTRSDIYSLGVILYELLTGTTPFDRDTMSKLGVDGFRKLLNEQDPERPSFRISTLKAQNQTTIEDQRQLDTEDISKQLKRELDWIVMKALEKDRERRYETANAFAADIQRYLNDEPVEACPPSLSYRTKKYITRHKGLISVAAIIVAMLITSTIVSAAFAMQARAAQQAAEASADDAQRQRETAIEAKRLADERLEAEQVARKISARERERADESLTAALDAIEQLLSHVGNPELAGIPKIQQIRASILEDSRKFYERFKADSGTSPEVDYRAAKVYLQLGELAQATHPESQQVIDAYDAGLKLSDGLVRNHPKRGEFRELNAEMHMACADYWWFPSWKATKEDYARAMKHFEQAEQQYAHLSQAGDDHDQYIRLQGFVFSKMSNLYSRQSKTDPRIAEFAKRAFASGVISHPLMAQVVESSDPELAERHWRQFVAEEGELPGDPSNLSGILYHKRLAAQFFSERDPELADRLWQEVISATSTLERDFPSNASYWGQLNYAKVQYASFLVRTDGVPQALRKMDTLIESDSAFHIVRAQVLSRWDDEDERMRLLGESIARFPKQSEYYCERARALQEKGDLEAALADWNNLLALDGNHQYAISSRGKVHTRLQNYRQAVDDLTRLGSLRSGDFWGWRKYRADAFFHVGDYDASLADLNEAMDQNPHKLSPLTQISPSEIGACEDEEFKEGILQLADRAVQTNKGSTASRIVRASLLIDLGQFERARDDLSEIIKRDDATYYHIFQAALISLELDDQPRFCQQTQKLVSTTNDASNPIAKHLAAWSASLTPNAMDNYDPAIKLARRALETDPDNQQYLNGLGAILMRAGEFEEAKERLVNALEAGESDNTSSNYSRYFLAMTEHHLDNSDAAADLLSKANESADQELAGSPVWNRKLTLELLRKEAEALIQR